MAMCHTASWSARRRSQEERERSSGDPPPAVTEPPSPHALGEGDPSGVQDDLAFELAEAAVDDAATGDDGGGTEIVLPVGCPTDDEDGAALVSPVRAATRQVKRPTLAEYQSKWADLRAKHSRCNPGGFGPENLCPTPVPQLWNDCPFVPFREPASPDAQARLS